MNIHFLWQQTGKYLNYSTPCPSSKTFEELTMSVTRILLDSNAGYNLFTILQSGIALGPCALHTFIEEIYLN